MAEDSGDHGRDFHLWRQRRPPSGQYLESIFGETGVPVVNVYNACATGSAAIRMAYNSVAAGETDTALAFGADVSPKGFLTAKSDNAVQDRDVIRWKMGGMPNPIYWALECRKGWPNTAPPKRIWPWSRC
jgi:3-oxoacyl-(acyl-carrier-protein) synthase